MGNYQRFKRIILLSVALVFGFFIAVAQANTSNLPFYWDFINVDIEVEANGDMLVTETQKYVFNSNYPNTRSRYIPLDKVDAIKDVTVEDENGQLIPSSTGKQNNELWIRWSHPLNPPESHIFVLKYRLIGGLQVDEKNTQVYWKAIFANRKSPIENATVKVKLPPSLAGKVISFESFGTKAVSRQLDNTTFEFVARSVAPGKELEVQVTFPTEILQVSQPNWQKKAKTDWLDTIDIISWLSNNVGSVLYFIVFALILPGYFIISIIKIIRRSYCPQCHKFSIKRTSVVSITPTYYSNQE